jgi:integrase/recombinase XerD
MFDEAYNKEINKWTYIRLNRRRNDLKPMNDLDPHKPAAAWISEFIMRYLTEGTRRAYRRVIREFFQFIGDCHPSDVTSSQINAWRDSLSGHNQPSTVHNKLIIIWTLFDFLRWARVVDENPAAKKHVPRPELPEFIAGRALTPKEVRCLLSGPDRSTPMGARDYALLTVMLRMALRVSEVCSLCPSSIIKERGILAVRVRIKGGWTHKLALPKDVWDTIQQSLTLDSLRGQGSDDNDSYIFQPSRSYGATNTSKPLSTRAAYKIVAKWAKRTGIGCLSPHDLRRTAVTQALNLGLSYRQIQMMTGHRKINTIQIYDYTRRALEEGAANFLNYDDDEPGKGVNSDGESVLNKSESGRMFARWKKRQLKRPEPDGNAPGVVLYAVLVRSIRVKGKPRQKIVRYLGSIRESKINKAGYRIAFWMKVERALKKQKVGDSIYQKILATLSKVVSLPTKDEVSRLLLATQNRSAHDV